MKKNKTLLILILIFVILLGGAYFLYGQLSGSLENDILSATNPDKDDADNYTNSETTDSATADSATANSSTADSATTGSAESGSNTETVSAPDFTVTDAAGNSVKLSDFFGKPIIVNFWASWCGPCKSEMADFNTAFGEYGEDIHFLMINLTDGSRETAETAQGYVDEQGYSFPIYFDTVDSNAAITYGAFSIPVTFFINEEGNIVAHGRGALDMDTLEQGISMIYNPTES